MLIIRSKFKATKFEPSYRYLRRDGVWSIKLEAARFTSVSAAEKFCEKWGIGFFQIEDEDEYDD